MEKGGGARLAVIALAALLLAVVPLAAGFTVDVTPKGISAQVQAGGYAAELVEVNADAPIVLETSASSPLRDVIRLRKHNDTAFLLLILPPQSTPQGRIEGTLLLTVQGSSFAATASAQRASIPLNVSILIQGIAGMPAAVQGESIAPLAFDIVIFVLVIVVVLIMVNMALRNSIQRGRK